jgi:hypothetical protein
MNTGHYQSVTDNKQQLGVAGLYRRWAGCAFALAFFTMGGELAS